jgi:hypothetical protein
MAGQGILIIIIPNDLNSEQEIAVDNAQVKNFKLSFFRNEYSFLGCCLDCDRSIDSIQ